MNPIKQAHLRLANADDVPAVLAAGWEVFELIAATAAASGDESPDMYPAYMFARGAAVTGRNAIAFAPSMPPVPADPASRPAKAVDDVYETADALADLASALSIALRASAELAVDAADHSACANAATEAERITQLLA